MSGMILLIISGTLIAIKLFAGNNLLIEILIRLSYIVAQFIVCLYFLKKHFNKQNMNPSIMGLIGLSPYLFVFISICYVFEVTLNIDQLEII